MDLLKVLVMNVLFIFMGIEKLRQYALQIYAYIIAN
jgi:hypothetical protein